MYDFTVIQPIQPNLFYILILPKETKKNEKFYVNDFLNFDICIEHNIKVTYRDQISGRYSPSPNVREGDFRYTVFPPSRRGPCERLPTSRGYRRTKFRTEDRTSDGPGKGRPFDLLLSRLYP